MYIGQGTAGQWYEGGRGGQGTRKLLFCWDCMKEFDEWDRIHRDHSYEDMGYPLLSRMTRYSLPPTVCAALLWGVYQEEEALEHKNEVEWRSLDVYTGQLALVRRGLERGMSARHMRALLCMCKQYQERTGTDLRPIIYRLALDATCCPEHCVPYCEYCKTCYTLVCRRSRRLHEGHNILHELSLEALGRFITRVSMAPLRPLLAQLKKETESAELEAGDLLALRRNIVLYRQLEAIERWLETGNMGNYWNGSLAWEASCSLVALRDVCEARLVKVRADLGEQAPLFCDKHGLPVMCCCRQCNRVVCIFCAIHHSDHTLESTHNFLERIRPRFPPIASIVHRLAHPAPSSTPTRRDQLLTLVWRGIEGGMDDEAWLALHLLGGDALAPAQPSPATPLAWDSCPVHGHRALALCLTCGRLVCWTEATHLGHAVESLKHLHEAYAGLAKKMGSWLQTRLESLREHLARQGEMLRLEAEGAEAAAAEVRALVRRADELRRVSTAALVAAGAALRSARPWGDILRVHIIEALISISCAEEVIVADLAELSLRARELEDGLKELQEREATITVQQAQVERALSGVGELDEDAILATVLLWMMGALDSITVDQYGAFPGVEKVFDIDGVMVQKLLDVSGIQISEPIKVDMGLRKIGGYFHASLSHRGVLAIYSIPEVSEFEDSGSDSFDYEKILQITDLVRKKQVEVKVEDGTSVAFYDDKMIVLTRDQPLRECDADAILEVPDTCVLERITEHNATPIAEVTRVHCTRVLYYTGGDYMLHAFNVDSREDKVIDIGRTHPWIVSLTGIDAGVEAVFQNWPYKTYAVGKDRTLTEIGTEGWGLTTLFPSASSPTDLSKAALMYRDCLVYQGKKIEVSSPIEFEANCCVVRLYKDVFLVYNKKTHSWVLSRIVVP